MVKMMINETLMFKINNKFKNRIMNKMIIKK